MSILQLGETLPEQEAEFGDTIEEPGREHDVQRRVAERHGERIAAERRAVDAEGEAARRVGGGKAGGHRKTAADPLGGCQDVGTDAGVLVGKEPPGTANAGLNLVEDEQELAPVADLAQAPQETWRDHAHAAFALNGFDHDGGRFRSDRGFDRLEVADRDLVEAFDLRPEALKVLLLTARGDGRERAAMKGAFERQDAIALRMAADPLAATRHLDRCLVGLCPGIGEEHEIRESRVCQTAGEPFALGVLVQVRHVPELSRS